MLAINFLCKQTTRMGDLQRHVIAPGVKTLVCSDSTSDNTRAPYQSRPIVSIGGQ